MVILMAGMDCSRVREMLADYSVGGLGWLQCRQVKHHLAECKECLREYDILLAACDLVRSLPEVEVPDHLWDNIRIGIAAAQPLKSSNPNFGFAYAFRLTALCAVLAVAGWLASKPVSQTPPIAEAQYGFFLRTHLAGSNGNIMLSDITTAPLQEISFKTREAPAKG